MDQHDLQSTLEAELVERLAGILWRLRRVPFFEAAILDARQAQLEHNARIETRSRGPWYEEPKELHDDEDEEAEEDQERSSYPRWTKLDQPDFTASARAGTPALVVVAEETIPEVYWLLQPPKLDRQALLGELKRGAEIPGAQLSNPCPVLTVRTK